MAGYNFTSDVTTGFDFTDGDGGGGGGGGGDATVVGAQLESWLTDNATEPAGWTFTGTAGSIRGYGDPVSGVPFRYVQLSTGSAASSSAALTQIPITYAMDSGRISTEWLVRTGPAITGEGALAYTGGFQFSHAAAWDDNIMMAIVPAASPFIGVQLIGASGAFVTSAVTAAVNTTYKFKLEVVGAGSDPGPGSDPRIIASINDVVFYSATFTAPTLDVVRLAHVTANGSDDPNDAYTMFIGPQATRWSVQ